MICAKLGAVAQLAGLGCPIGTYPQYLEGIISKVGTMQ